MGGVPLAAVLMLVRSFFALQCGLCYALVEQV